MIFAGIGSRKTPERVLAQMTRLGQWALKMDHTVRSGHADGADWAFEQGAQEACDAFIPWPGFNKHLVSGANLIVPPFDDDYYALVQKYHPAPHRLTPGARKLMARNSCQILGLHLNAPSDAVVCWTPGGVVTGGTGQAIRMAEDHGIPVINMYQYPDLEAVLVQMEDLDLF